MRERALNDPALSAQTAAMLAAAAGDHRLHAPCPQLPAVLVVVIAAISENPVGSLTRTADLPSDGADAIDQRQEPG